MRPDVWLRATTGAGELWWAHDRAATTYAGDRTMRAAARILGARNLVQATLTQIAPTRRTRRINATIDLIHAGSMVLVAVAQPRRARICLLSAATATALALVSLRAAER